MEDVYRNIKNYIPQKERNVLIVFVDMIGYMISNKKLIQYLSEVEDYLFH